MHRTSTGPLKSAGPLEPGKEYDFKIVKISPETRRIGLSYRAAVKQQERREIDQYKSTSTSKVFVDRDDRRRAQIKTGPLGHRPQTVNNLTCLDNFIYRGPF